MLALAACQTKSANTETTPPAPAITGTWRLLSGTLIEKGDTTTTNYNKDISFIKIINNSHFAFLQHDLKKGKDSAAVFVAGGGTYTFRNNQYTENLEYCSAREWEGNKFDFTVTFKGDTLVQRGVEKVADAGVDRINMETYVRVKD
ncbi:hypothetical protein BUE76_17770 [Cnuella takakiae]|nr:hypothetical protein BUE76_17770 [Cnuella takakiae]